jgi:hypothetical protein
MELQDLPQHPLAAVPVLDSQVDSPGRWLRSRAGVMAGAER